MFLVQFAVILVLVGLIRSAFNWDWEGRPVAPALAQAMAEHQVPPAAGEPLMVQIWATWCGICALEQSTMARLAQSHRVFSVAMQSGSREEVQAYLQERGVSYDYVVDTDGALSSALEVKGVPTTILIGPDGLVHLREAGYTSYWGYRLRLWLVGWLYG